MFKYCPACQADLKTNDRKLSCDACNFIFFISPAAAASIIATDSETGKFILSIRKHEPKKGSLDVIGGFMEHNESVEEAACREFKEETGYNINPTDIQCLTTGTHRYTYANYEYSVIDMIFTTTVPFAKLKPMDDVENLVLINPDEIDVNKLAFATHKKAFQILLSK